MFKNIQKLWLKGLIMDRCVLLTSTSGFSRRAGRLRGRSPSVRPAARQPTRELMSTTHTYPWLIPIITWGWQFPSLSTNILLIKSKLNLESRAIVVGVAMSPRNLGGKYCCRPKPRWRKCTRQFFPRTRACQSNCIRVASSLAWRQHCRSCVVFKSLIYMAHCPFQRKWRVLRIRYISVLEQVGMSLNWIAYLMKVCLLFKREFPRVLMTLRTARARISSVRSPM